MIVAMKNTTIVWFHKDLRLEDNPALAHAAQNSKVIPVFIFDEETRQPGAASRWWLHKSLQALQASLQKKGGELYIFHGKPSDILPDLAQKTGAQGVFWNRQYDTLSIKRDKQLKQDLKDQGLNVESFNGHLLVEPWHIQNKSGGYYKVFTPYWKQLRDMDIPNPVACPEIEFSSCRGSTHIEDFAPRWAKGFESWQPGEIGAKAQLEAFLKQRLNNYGEGRDRPDKDNTSGLSPHLAWGDISPRVIWHTAKDFIEAEGLEKDGQKFLSELAWREFSYNLLYHFPDLPHKNFNPKFDDFPWVKNQTALEKWQAGQTGYPIVDAGMRQLWHTGWMHNRVRMIVASFLIKDLMIHWKEGERWFWDTLVDADIANNTASWQWVAGCGADAAPYFRIFNPVTQSQKFDPNGDYIRQWVPELKGVDNKVLHAPWQDRPMGLKLAGVELGKDYPEPMVDHKQAREDALAAFKSLK